MPYVRLSVDSLLQGFSTVKRKFEATFTKKQFLDLKFSVLQREQYTGKVWQSCRGAILA